MKIEITVGYLLQLELCHDPPREHIGMLAWCLISQTGNQQFQWGFAGMLEPRDQCLKCPEVSTTTDHY